MAKIENKLSQCSINQNKFVNLVIAGIVATVAFNAVMYTDIAVTGIPLDIAAVLGQITVGESEYSQAVGHAIHYGNGIGLALIFGYVVIPLSKRFTKLPIILVSMGYMTIELIIAVWFMMLPALDAGIAGLGIAPEVPVVTLIRHLVFGLVLGIFARRNN